MNAIWYTVNYNGYLQMHFQLQEIKFHLSNCKSRSIRLRRDDKKRILCYKLEMHQVSLQSTKQNVVKI